MGYRRVTPPAGAGALLRPGLWGDLRLAWRLLRDPRVAPKLKLATPLLAALYVVSPVDLLPDVLLGVGQLDDLGIVGLAVAFLTRVVPRLAPPDVLDEHLVAMGRREPETVEERRRHASGTIETTFRIRES